MGSLAPAARSLWLFWALLGRTARLGRSFYPVSPAWGCQEILQKLTMAMKSAFLHRFPGVTLSEP